MAVRTVGTGKTYATISAAITASSSGDIIEVYATTNNTYNEALTVNKSLQIFGMVANQGLTVKSTAATVVSLTVGASTFENFKVDGTGGAGTGCIYIGIGNCVVSRCIAFGANGAGLASGAALGLFSNCIAYGNANGYNGAAAAPSYLSNCTLAKNTNYGATNTLGSANTIKVMGCLAAGNGTADYNAAVVSAAQSPWNVSADASAVGGGSVTGFLTTDFENYAGNDFRLKSSVKTTTLARILGYPLDREDYLGDVRRRSGHFYAGAHDPDPDAAVEPAAPGLAARDDETGSSVTATVDGDAGVTNKVYRRAAGESGWTLGASRAGDGEVQLTGLARGGRYQLIALSEAGGARSLPSNVAGVLVTDGGLSPEARLQANVIAILQADARLQSRAAQWSAHVLAPPESGAARGRSLGRLPRVEVGRVEILRNEAAGAEADRTVARLALRCLLAGYSPADAEAIHDFAGDVLLALAAEPQLAAPELVAGFTCTAAAPQYAEPVWTAEIAVLVRLALDPSSRGPVS